MVSASARGVRLIDPRQVACIALCIAAAGGAASGYALLDFPSDVAVQSGGYKSWVLPESVPRVLSLSYAIESDFLPGVEGAFEAAGRALASWDTVSPLIRFSQAGYEPVVNSSDNLIAGGWHWEGSGALAGVGIGANIDIMSRPADFQFVDFRGRTHEFGDMSLGFTAPIALSGDIVSVDIYLNSDFDWAVDGSHFDVETVMLHELGHALGLHHPDQAEANGAANYTPWTDEPGKQWSTMDVMHSDYFPAGVKRSLTKDERGGLAFLYGLLQSSMDIVLSRWGDDVPPWSLSDPSGDGFVGEDDLDMVLSLWHGASIEPQPSSAPEPATLSLLALAGLLSLRRRRLRLIARQ